MRLKIVQVGEPVLRVEARALEPQEIATAEVQQLIDHMKETMRDAPGVGLAAPQIGISLQLAVIEDAEEYLKLVSPADLAERERSPVPFHVLINPRIIYTSEQKVEFFEGCLSLSGFSGVVPRAHSVKVEWLDEFGEPRQIEASGWYARILQHEIDHLRGNLYIDRMRSRTFSSLENFGRFWRAKPIGEVLAETGKTETAVR